MADLVQMNMHQPRAYQIEMLEASMKENVVVAMDTGSGKTNIAILRVAEAFKRPESVGKIAWFLCPNVALAQQQHAVIEKQLPGLSARLIIGDDGVDHWSTQEIWDAIFLNMNVIVSTYQVLYDALQHAFTSMEKLCLLVVDEAHNCHGNTPINRIMQRFYHPAKLSGNPTPTILGLTASPVVKSDIKEMEIIEASLDALCRSPVASREELLKYTHQPKMRLEAYRSIEAEAEVDPLLSSFQQQYEALDMSQDPDVVQLLKDGYNSYDDKYYDAFECRRTFVCKQLRSFQSNAKELHCELGVWASRRYLTSLHMEVRDQLRTLSLENLRIEQLSHLCMFFERVQIPLQMDDLPPIASEISPKANKLLELLMSELVGNSAGIVFAKMKSTVSLMRILIENAEPSKDLVRVGSFVGLSSSSERAHSVGNSLDKGRHLQNLSGLRNREKNLIVSTSACEEGIDISACNFVICFEEPPNLKSYIQRRGRARAEDSKYLIMHTDEGRKLKKDWETLEMEMKEAYNDEDRQQLERIEEEESSSEEYKDLVEPSTGATVTLDDAVAHLDHFCNRLPTAEFASCHPEYIFSKAMGGHSCTVTLPNAMKDPLRRFRTSRPWPTQRLAKKDAALEAYTALYNARLLNKNLLPEPPIDSETESSLFDVEKRDSIESVPERHDPTQVLSVAWQSTKIIYRYCINHVERLGQVDEFSQLVSEQIMVGLPLRLDGIEPLTVYWDKDHTWTLKLSFHSEVPSQSNLDMYNSATHVLLRSAFRSRMNEVKCQDDSPQTPTVFDQYPVLFFPGMEKDSLSRWIHEANAVTDGQDSLDKDGIAKDSASFIIRLRNAGGRGFVFQGTGYHEQARRRGAEGQERPMVLCYETKRLPRRTDFLHPVPEGYKQVTTLSWLPCENTEIVRLSVREASFALLIPSIVHHVGNAILAEQFRSQVVSPPSNVHGPAVLTSTILIQEALSSPSAREPSNYQRLEFLGDAILGLCASVQAAADHPMWHEGYLTRLKSHIVSNGRLAKGCCNTGVTQYILAKAFTGLKWRPPVVRGEQVEEDRPSVTTRQLSTKILADVVEALIGASFQEAYQSGLAAPAAGIQPGLVSLLRFFIPRIEWLEHEENILKLRKEAIDSATPLPGHFAPLEELIGYHFENPIFLVEALTHPSYTVASSVTSYNRLEFLGDSVLQFLVTRFIFNQGDRQLPVPRMHLLRTAAVNNQLLAFLAMRMKVAITQNEIVSQRHNDDGSIKENDNDGYNNVGATVTNGGPGPPRSYVPVRQSKEKALHDFMFHGPFSSLAEARQESIERFERYDADLDQSLFAGSEYPWTLLARFGPEKYLGDIVESVLGAIYVDSGSAQACSDFLDKLGIWAFLRHAIARDVKLRQPKEELGIIADQDIVSYETHQRKPGASTSIPSDSSEDDDDAARDCKDVSSESADGNSDVDDKGRQGDLNGQASNRKNPDDSEGSDTGAVNLTNRFFSSVFVGIKGLGRGSGRSKLEAETMAAAEALRRIREEGGGSVAAVQPIPELGLKRKREPADDDKEKKKDEAEETVGREDASGKADQEIGGQDEDALVSEESEGSDIFTERETV